MKEKIALWFCMGLWTEDMVNAAVTKGILTMEEAAKSLMN